MAAFEAVEYKERLRKVKEKMLEHGMEVLIVSHPSNMNYLSGFEGWSFYVHQGLIVSLDYDEPIWFGREQDSNAARIYGWMKDENVRGYADRYVMSKFCHPMEYVANILKEKGWDKRHIGVETDGYYFSARGLESLRSSLPEATVKDDGLVVNIVRRVKSPSEIALIRKAGRIVTHVMNTAIETIDVGVRENDAAAAVYEAQIAGLPDCGGDFTSLFPIMPSGIRTSSAHLSWETDRVYEKNEPVLLELAGAHHHYHCPLSRTMYLGEAPDELNKIAKVVINGLEKTLDFIKPGITAEEVEACWRGCLKGTGVEKPSRVGYSFGVGFPPDWGEQNISLRPKDTTVLEPGMCLHFMPGIWLEKFGFENSEPILITEKGCECFVDFPRKIFTK